MDNRLNFNGTLPLRGKHLNILNCDPCEITRKQRIDTSAEDAIVDNCDNLVTEREENLPYKRRKLN